MSTESYGVITFNGIRFPVVPTVTYRSLAQWQGKIVSGDYSRDSDETISSKIWTAFAGGIGVDQIREGSDEGAYWFGTLNALYPFQLALGNRAVFYSGVRYPLGDLNNINYAASATQVKPWDEETLSFGTALTNNLAAPPTAIAEAFGGNQYIPLGSNGYAHHDGVTVTNSTAIDVLRFLAWDNRLLALTTDGSLLESLDGQAWATTGAQVNASETPKNLVAYTDRQDNETAYIVTDRRTYAYDPITSLLIPTRLVLPPHPDNGQGAAVWRPGEDLFISSGIGTYRFNLSAIAPVGLDRRQGLPSEYRGVIRDLCPEHNMLVAYVEGAQIASEAAVPEIQFDEGQYRSGVGLRLAGTEAVSLLAGWNGFGWHPLWTSPDSSGEPVWCAVSGAQDTYRLWWGYGTSADDGVYTQRLSRTFANPRQLIDSAEGDFAPSGFIDTGWFDANMREFLKLGSHLEVNVENASDTEVITVLYKRDFDTDWTLMGNITERGKAVLPLGVRDLNGFDFSYGLTFSRIRFRIEFARDPGDVTVSPLLDSLVLKYIKLPIDSATFELQLILDMEDFEGRGPDQIKAELDELLTGEEFIAFNLADWPEATHRVRLSFLSGVDFPGADLRGNRRITVIEVPLPGYQGRGDE